MALDPPWEVVSFLNFIGVKWPMINEDTVRAVAGMIQEFAAEVQSTHEQATSEIQAMAAAYQGGSYDKLCREWESRSKRHMAELADACRVIVDALHLWADYIVEQKAVAITQLVALAASFLAAQAAAVATFGLSEVADLGLDEAAQQAIRFLKSLVNQYLQSKVIEEAFKLLAPAVLRAAEGFVFHYVDGGAPPSPDGAGASVMVDADALMQHANTLNAHGQAMRQLAHGLAQRLSAVEYS